MADGEQVEDLTVDRKGEFHAKWICLPETECAGSAVNCGA